MPKGVIPIKEAVTVHGPGNCNWSVEDKVPKDATPMLRFEVGKTAYAAVLALVVAYLTMSRLVIPCLVVA